METVTFLACENISLRVAWSNFKGRNHKGEPKVNKSVKFLKGVVVLYPEKDEEDIAMLLAHKGNVANGGKSFRRQSPEIDALEDVSQGLTFAMMPDDGLQESDIEGLKYLTSVKPSMPPKVVEKATAIATSIHKRFRFAGVPVPNGNITSKRLRARIIEMLETLEERSIWVYDDTTGKKPS